MHIEPKPIAKYPFYLRCYFYLQEKRLGKVLLPGFFWGRLSFFEVMFLWLWRHLDKKNSSLSPELRALSQVRVAQLNACLFCIDYNSLKLRNRTSTLEKVDELPNWKESSLFSELEKDVLEFVERVTGLNVQVTSELMDRLKVHFSDDQIVELTALIAFQNMTTKFNCALVIPSQGMCVLEK